MKRALVCSGQGYGNIVMSTPCVSLLEERGYMVDIWLEPT